MKYQIINKNNNVVKLTESDSLSNARYEAMKLYGFKHSISPTRFISKFKGELCIIPYNPLD